MKKSTSGAARVLTSTENLEILKEKERKNRELQEEKARCKEERARKAQEREREERLRQKKEAERAARQNGKCKPSWKARKCSCGVMKRGAKSRSIAQSDSVEEAGLSEQGGWSVSSFTQRIQDVMY